MLLAKWNGGVRRVLLGTIVFVAANTAALADTSTLICQFESGLQVTIDLNASEGNATVNFPAENVPGGTMSPFSETYAATFDPKIVTFGGPMPSRPSAYRKFTVDRVSGTLTEFFGEGAPYDQAAPSNRRILTATCRVGKAQF